MVEDRKALFERIYANLPLGFRRQIVVVVDGEPLTWHAARVEVENDTKKGKQILDKLIKLKILK